MQQRGITNTLTTITTDSDILVYPSPTTSARVITIKHKKHKKLQSGDNTGNTGSDALTATTSGCNCEWRGVPGYALYDGMGEPTGISGTLTTEDISVDVSALSPVIYQLVVTTSTTPVTKTVVVQ